MQCGLGSDSSYFSKDGLPKLMYKKFTNFNNLLVLHLPYTHFFKSWRNATINPGMFCPFCYKFWGQVYVMEGAPRPRDAPSKGCSIQGMLCPWGALSMGRFVHGALCPWDAVSRDTTSRVRLSRDRSSWYWYYCGSHKM
jgi:hypothetical protein